MMMNKLMKPQSMRRAIKVQEAKNSSESTLHVEAKIRMYCSRMTVLMIAIAELYGISLTQAHCCHASPQLLNRVCQRRTNTSSCDCVKDMASPPNHEER